MKNVPGFVTNASYDALGRPEQRQQANGTTTFWEFDERGSLRRIQTTSTGEPGGVIQDLQYTPDALGRVETVTSPFPNESWSYGYDLLGRLQTATSLYDPAQSQAFDYDLAGNKTYDSRIGTISYPLPGSPRPHAPTTVAGQPMTYDLNGNLVSGRGRSYDWNVDNKPTTVNGLSFAYAGDGTRLKKTAPGGATLFPLGDDYEIKDGVATKYLRLGGAPIAKRVGATSYWLHADRLGSVQAVTDAAGQNALRRTYRPYGQKIADSTTHWEPLGYIGERLDEETSLTYLHARYYDSELGTFVSPDPLDPDAGGVGPNRYAYVAGNPVAAGDPSGLMPMCGPGARGLVFTGYTEHTTSTQYNLITTTVTHFLTANYECVYLPDIFENLHADDNGTSGGGFDGGTNDDDDDDEADPIDIGLTEQVTVVAKALTGKVNASIKEANKDGTWYDWIDETHQFGEDHPKIHFYYSCISMRRSHRAGAANVLGIPAFPVVDSARKAFQAGRGWLQYEMGDQNGGATRFDHALADWKADFSGAAASLNPFETCETQARQY